MSVTFQLAGQPSITATVKNSEFGETESLNVKSRLHLSMDGTVFTYKNTPGSNLIHMEFKVVTREKMDLLMEFITATAGRFIQMNDWNGDVRFGRIVTIQPEVIVIDSLCNLETALDFEETVN